MQEEKNAAAMAETTAAPGLQARPSPIPVPDHDMGVGNFVLSWAGVCVDFSLEAASF